MSRGHRVGVALAAIALGSSLIVTGCSDDKAVAPIAPKDYAVYFGDGAIKNWYFEYHPLTNRVDSFYVPFQAWSGIDASADGTRLFIGGTASIAVVDLDSKTIVEELPYKGAVVVSPDNRWLAVTGDDLYILRASDYSVIFHDTTKTGWGGAFTPHGERFFCPAFDTVGFQNRILRVDIENGFAMSVTDFPEERVGQIIPSPDEILWFIYLNPGYCSSEFRAYMPSADSTLAEGYLEAGKGGIAISPDGRCVFYTGPGPWIINGPYICSPPVPEFYVYDVQANVTGVIGTTGIIEDSLSTELYMGDLAITPDGCWLVAVEGSGRDVVVAYDMTTLKLSKYARLGGVRQFHSLTCQKMP